MATDVDRRLRREVLSRLRRTSVGRVSGEDLREGNGGRSEFGRVEHAKEGAGETAAESGGDVVRMPLDHEGVVLDAGLGELEVSEGVTEEDTGDDSGRGGAHSTSEGNLVVHFNLDDGGREGEVVGEEDVERDAGDEVLVRVEGGVGGAFAGVGDVDGGVGGGGGGEGHLEREVTGEGESENVETGSDVGGRGRDTDGPLRERRGSVRWRG
jgi:hypothetical protein